MSNATIQEQYMLELINRARLDPLSEAARLGIDLNQGLTAGTITTASKQPLAMNNLLINSSRTHSTWMLDNDIFSHTGSGGSDPGQRMAAAGYVFAGSWTWGENISRNSIFPVPIDLSVAIGEQHDSLFRSPGHRTNIMSDAFREIGVGQVEGVFTSGGTPWNTSMVTQNFARSGNNFFLTGVVYNDSDNNDFYTMGEGIGGILAATGAASNTSGIAGGYELSLAAGSHNVTIGGASFSVTIDTRNVKVDLVNGNQIWTTGHLVANSGIAELHALGIDAVNLSAGAGAQSLFGNAAANVLNGGAGNDALIGAGGTDTAVFSGNMAAYAFNFNAATATYTIYNPDGSIDTATGIENFQFADGTRTAAQLPITSGPPIRTVSVAAVTASQTEGNAGTKVFGFTVTLNGAAFSTQTVTYTAAGNGANPANAADFSGALTGTVTFLAGESTKSVEVLVQGDTTSEANETFAVTLSAPSAGLTLGTASATATITNDDSSAPNVINGTAGNDPLTGTAGIDHIFGLAGNDTLNGAAGNDLLDGGAGNDTLDGGADTDIAVFAGNMALYAFNFSAASGTYTIYNPDGTTDTAINVENFQFADGTRTAAQLPITAGPPSRTVSIAAVTASQTEGNAGLKAFNFDVTLNGPVWTTQTVTFTAAGNGASPANAADFSGALTGTVTFLAGESAKTVQVLVQGDTLGETNETFAVTLSAPSAGLTLGTATAAATITNDDAGGPNVINGTAGNDPLTGTAGIDHIFGFAGNDTLDGAGANDRIEGGDGNDTIFGGLGVDYLDGGNGSDIIHFDASDSTVLGGAGTDKAVFVGTTAGLRSYDFVGRGFESLEWVTNGNTYRLTPGAGGSIVETVTDTAGTEASFASRVTTLDALRRVDLENLTRDNGTRVVNDYDPANSATWSRIVDSFDTLNRLDARDVFYDDGTRTITDYDQADVGTWSSHAYFYTAGNALDFRTTLYDNGTRLTFDVDQANAATWASIATSYAAGTIFDYRDTVYDSGARLIFDADQANTATWSSITTSYAAGGALDYRNTVNDNGTRVNINYDDASAFTWRSWQFDYNAAGALTRQVITYDDGSVVIL